MPRLGLTTTSVVGQGAELADEIGFAHVSVTTLARRLGIRTASLYAHVQGNDDLRMIATFCKLLYISQNTRTRTTKRASSARCAAGWPLPRVDAPRR